MKVGSNFITWYNSAAKALEEVSNCLSIPADAMTDEANVNAQTE